MRVERTERGGKVEGVRSVAAIHSGSGGVVVWREKGMRASYRLSNVKPTMFYRCAISENDKSRIVTAILMVVH